MASGFPRGFADIFPFQCPNIAEAGLPAERANHAEIALNTALDMMEVIAKYGEDRRKAGKPCFRFRAGIHPGPLVAGIVGNKKIAYDFWGDTVNIAARVEQTGEGGNVNISCLTCEPE